MITRRHLLAGSAATLVAPIAVSTAMAQTQAARVTILFDAFGRPSDLKRGWGYSSLIEYGGRRILFDTGSNGANFEHNVKSLGIGLEKLDFVVISHRHNDHTAGLHYVLRENPSLTIYTPVEGAGFNGQTGPALMNLIKRYVASVPDDMRYFGGNPPTENRSESPWPGARFVQITEPKEVLPGFFLFTTRSEVPGTREMNEISLVIKTPKGGVLVVGCSHPGIERLVEAATKIDSQLYEVFGGFHLVDIPDDKVTEMVTAFRDKWKIERMAAGHCTGQFAFAELIRVFGPRFDPAGVGSVISLPS
jgi:7,8-dihydropterin-6-yl-methyl-4-(beta-D-ribofuranosyl)aminobenzene 5'-phosphate synthase